MGLLMRIRAAGKRVAPATTRTVRTACYSTQSTVWTWGTGTQGQLGHGPVVKSGIRNAYEELSPKILEAFEGAGIKKLNFGAHHSAAIDDQGQLYMWGSNEYNRLGLGKGAAEMEVVPKRVEALTGIEIVDVSCGHYHTAAVDKEGKMYSWGWGSSTMKGCGALGHAGGEDEPTPRLLTTLVDQGVPIARVECGELHTLALTTDGEIWTWGNGEYGRLGNGESDNYEVPEPVEFFADENIKEIAAGKDFSFALTEKGELYGWGGNSHNQLGLGGGLAMDVYKMESIPVLVETFDGVKVKQIAAGNDHAAAITEDGRLYTWGSRMWQIPNEVTILNDENIVQVACGRVFTAALTADGKLFTVGKGSSNSLGHGDRKNQLQPLHVRALAGYKIVSVACGESHMGAISEAHAEAVDRDFSFRH